MTPATVAALLRERQGYVSRNLPDRVAAVDAQLAQAGYRSPEPPRRKTEPETASIEAQETASIQTGRPRRSDPNG